MSGLKEKISEAISTHISLDDTYTYELTRVKTAFEVGTMSLEDFEEWSDENVNNLAESIVDVLQPQLNDNQKIVLEWLKNEISENDLQYTLWSFTEDVYEKLEIGAGLAPYIEAWEKLKEKQKFEVLAAFAQWGLEQEEAE
ncbi:TPA: hypothetical protein QFF42_000115 [Enterococcus faecium]|nr:hypothetical protein [Enterococcus faecium]